MTSLNSNCPICKNKAHIVLTERLRRGEGTVYKCSDCNHGFLPVDDSINFKDYYSTEYRTEYSHSAEASDTNAEELFQVYSKYQEYRLPSIIPYLSKTKSFLEIGASAGQFIHHIRDKVHSVNAIELDKACCHYLQTNMNIEADSEYLENSKFKNKKYDVICSFQVMEHVPSPLDFLKIIHQSLEKKGVALIEVPNLYDPLLSVWDVEEYNEFYYHSSHLHYFSKESLKIVAQKAGFQEANIKFEFIQDYNLLNHLHWSTTHKPQETCEIGLAPIELKGKDEKISQWLNQEMSNLNEEYNRKLIEAEKTSNIMMVLHA